MNYMIRWMMVIGCSALCVLLLPHTFAQDKFVDSLNASVEEIRPQLERSNEYGLVA